MPRVRDTGGRAGETDSLFLQDTASVPPAHQVPGGTHTLALPQGHLQWRFQRGPGRAAWGRDAPGLSPTTIGRLKDVWKQELGAWQGRDLSKKRYVYFWADGVYFNVRLEQDKQCILVIIGTDDERPERAGWSLGRLPGKRAILARAFAGPQAARAGDSSQAGGGRRRPGILEGAAPGLFPTSAINAAGCTRRPTY